MEILKNVAKIPFPISETKHSPPGLPTREHLWDASDYFKLSRKREGVLDVGLDHKL